MKRIIFSFFILCFIAGCDNIYISFRNNNKLKIILTFDDGTEGHYFSAFNIMKKYNVRGTFYIITDLIGQSGRLNIEQLNEMYEYGNEIASHSANHPIFIYLNEDEIEEELVESKTFLVENGYFTGGFAYPGHKRNDLTNSKVLQYFPYIRPNVHKGTAILRDDVNRMLSYITNILNSGYINYGIFVNIHLVEPSTHPSSAYVVHEINFEYFITELLNMDINIITSREYFERR